MEVIRHNDVVFVARIVFRNSSFLEPLYDDTSYVSFCDEVRSRHKIASTDNFSLVYSTPSASEVMLSSEQDFKLMFFTAKTYCLKEIEVTVRLDSVSKFKKSRVELFDLNSDFNENEYLGTAFQSVQSKSFLSDEWGFFITGEGQKFVGGVSEFRDKLKKYAVQRGFSYFYARNDSVYVNVVCEDMDCSFFINGSVYSVNKCFYIVKCELSHTCSTVLRQSKHGRLDSDVVANCLSDVIMYNPNIGPTAIIKKFKVDYGFDIGYKVASVAKTKALQKIYGKEGDSFNKLRWFVDAVTKTNPGSFVDLEVNEETNRFSRIFVAYAGCVEGLKHCVPVLYVDGCFGKSMYKGQILAATSKDGNRGIFPVALCVCDSENEDNWLYFFRCLKPIVLAQPRVITFISDRGLGLLKACDQIFPDNPHMYCYQHLQSNLRRRFTGRGSGVRAKSVAYAFWKCAYSSTEKEYYHNLKDLRNDGGEDIINDFLKDLPVTRWCRAFSVGSRFGIMANTVAECFNSWINLERSMPVYSMLEEVRLKQMNLISDRSFQSDSWATRITPAMEKVLEKKIDKCRRFRVVKSQNYLFQVRDIYSYEVDLASSSCSCVKWQINCFPCPHAVAAILYSKLDIYNFIHPVYTVAEYRKVYAVSIKPISNVEEQFFETSELFIQPPAVKSQPGRRKKQRFKSVFEESRTRKIVCGRCGKKGNHNKLTCSEPISRD